MVKLLNFCFTKEIVVLLLCRFMSIRNRRKVFQEIRKALELIQKENYTKAFNLLSQVEKNLSHPYLDSKIVPLKMHCLVKVGNLTAAKDYIENKISENPINPFYYHEAARYYHKVGQYDRANRYYMRTICLAPDRIDYSLSYSHFLRERNSPEKALEVLFRCLRENRKLKNRLPLILLYQEIALIYYQKKFYLRALILFNYCHLSWQDFAYRDLLADCYLQKGRYRESLALLEEHFAQWGENDPEAIYTKAKALAALGERERALDCLLKCQKIWGELVVTGGDLAFLQGLVQDGSIKRIPNVAFIF